MVTTTALQVAASQGRQRLPTEWLLVFEEWSNTSLISWSKDATGPSRAYAGWELDYRLAFGIDVNDSGPELRAHEGDTKLNEIVKKLIQGRTK